MFKLQPLVEKILSQKGPKKVRKEVFWDPHGKDLGPLGTRMGAFWELVFWDFPIEWHIWEFLPSCPATVTYAGFPIRNNLWGCNNNWGERLGFSTTTGVISCTTQSDTPTGRYTGSSCQGMSGGPMWNPSTNIVNGILSQGSLACSTTRTSSVSFAAITNSLLSWGVHVAGLIAAIP
eukprot:jgi/Botrbrau1/2881/Bobra.0036s0024.1